MPGGKQSLKHGWRRKPHKCVAVGHKEMASGSLPFRYMCGCIDAYPQFAKSGNSIHLNKDEKSHDIKLMTMTVTALNPARLHMLGYTSPGPLVATYIWKSGLYIGKKKYQLPS